MVRVSKFSLLPLLLPAAAMATPTNSREQAALEQAIQEAADAAMVEMIKPGPLMPGWNKGGIDLYKMLESRTGGLAANYLLTVDKDGDRSVRVIGSATVSDMVPKPWKSVLRAGTAQLQQGPEIAEFARLDGTYYIAGQERHRRVGDSYCTDGKMSAELYESPGGQAGELPPELVPAFFHATVTRLEAQQLCWRYDRDGDGYRVRYFLEDGRTLPGLDEYKERVTIIPAAPIDVLLEPKS